MEYIIDNGEGYSAHEILFFHGDLDPNFLKKVLEVFHPEYTILGVAEKIDWWIGGVSDIKTIFYPEIFFSRNSSWSKDEESNYSLLVESTYHRGGIKVYLKPEVFEFKEFILGLLPDFEKSYKASHRSKEYFLFLKEKLTNS